MRLKLRRWGSARGRRGNRGRDAKDLMLVHIGTHKTGTTAIQNYLASHRATLREAGFVYPKAGIYGDQHAALPAAFMGGHPILPKSLLGCDPAPLVAQIRAEVPPGYNALLSSEAFWELLTYLAPDFHTLHGMLSKDWDVRYLYMTREPHKKTWSAIKHMAREGMVFDIAATYARDLTTTEGTEERLLATYPQSVRVEYDGRDSVDQLLAFLTSDPAVQLAGMTPDEGAVVRRMRARRTPDSGDRLNQNLASPYGAAVTLAVTESLWAVQGANGETLVAFPKMYNALFRDDRIDWSDPILPDDRSLHARVQATADHGGAVMNTAEIRAVRGLMAAPAARRRAQKQGLSTALDQAVSALDQRLARAVEDPS